MFLTSTHRRLSVAAVAAVGIVAVSLPAHAAKPSGSTCSRKTTCSPTIAFASPASGSTLSGTATLTGSASGNNSIVSVQTSVDGGAWTTASGTTSWSSSVDTKVYADGSHTLYARATDSTGATTTTMLGVSFANASPTVTISSPSSGSSVAGTVGVTGSASDPNGISRVDVQVDGGAWQAASGTTSWSWTWDSSSVANGSHTLAARATDTAGNVATTSATVSVSNSTADTTAPTVSITTPANGATVSGTTTVAGTASDNVSVSVVAVQVDAGSWQTASGTTSWSLGLNTAGVANGTHTITARATDASGNTRTSSVSVTVSNTSSTTAAPNTQGSWVSPEGVTINVSSAGPWTISQIYSMLTANALDLSRVGPDLTINVQDSYSTQTSCSATLYMGQYSGFHATMYLQGVNSGFAQRPDAELTHEYGHAWSRYYYYLAHNADWSAYESVRWTTADGSLTLATDSRTDSSYSWNVAEIVADDYRLLFGSSAAVSERPSSLNTQIPAPTNVPGLRDWLYQNWRTA